MRSQTVSIQYSCINCGSVFSKWSGKCDVCDSWNSIVEEELYQDIPSNKLASKSKLTAASKNQPIRLGDIQVTDEQIIPTHIMEFDRLLGKGLVEGSVVLLGGEPGIGKSTIAMQIAQKISAAKKHKVLYISGEESEKQVLMRASRLDASLQDVLVYCENDIQNILNAIQTQKPDVIILDSIQVVYHREIPSYAGSINQVRHCAMSLINIVKSHALSLILIGHITKDGSLAGPKTLEHMVDAILFFEGERDQKYRLLRCFKNRFSSTEEIAFFKMGSTGLEPVSYSADLFIGSHTLSNPGSMVVPIMMGCRVMLIEVQSLVVDSSYGMAKRTFSGTDSNRINLMIAALEKMATVKLSTKDIFINIIGGLKVSEPALDLGVVLSLVSSLYEKPLTNRLAVMGEVGLTGEIRPIANIERRVKELENMNFNQCILPASNQNHFPKKLAIQPIFVNTISEAIRAFLS